jgi:adenylylsulfate reductase subunit A
MEKETCNFSFCAKPEVVEIETDILLIGGGMACCGAAFEAARWATPKGIKITMVDKAATDRSGAVAMGLSAINTYVGENKVEDYVRYVRNDLMGIIREDLVFDLGRHVDDSVQAFEEWGLPIWKKAMMVSPWTVIRRLQPQEISERRRHTGKNRKMADHDQW